MLRPRALLSAVLAAAAFAPAAAAQCIPVGNQCSSGGMRLACGAPQIGTFWSIGESNAAACGGSPSQSVPMLTVLGPCLVPGIVIGAPLACATCTTCELHVLPVDVAIQWIWPPRTVQVPIPNNMRLVGAQFCIQNFCFDLTNACICMSGAGQVTITT